MNTRIILKNLLNSSIFTHIIVLIVKYNYFYNCTILSKTVIYVYINIITHIKVNTHKYSYMCTYKQI